VAESRAEQPASPLAIRLLGPFEVRVAARPLPPLRTRKGQSLLALLTLRHGAEVQRSWLAGTLWPDSLPSDASYNLRRSLCDLRRALGPEGRRLGCPTPHTLRFDPVGVAVDALAFEAAIAQGGEPSLERAVTLYRGPLLEGCEEEWVFPERDARKQAYLLALEMLAAGALARGDPVAAVRHLRRAVAADPLRETAQRDLLQALAAGGNLAAATLAYREFRLLLHRELHEAPAPETSALFQQIRAETRQAGCRRGGTRCRVRANEKPAHREPEAIALGFVPRPLTELVGREDEVRAIEACLASARLVTLTGTGGVGKTRLAIQVAEELAEDYQDGAWFVDLGALADPALVPHAVAAVLGVREEPGRPMLAALQEFLRPKALLLVLDNCEHLLAACAHLAEGLLHGCRHLQILATSREALGLTGETAWRVPSLPFPDPAHLPSAAVELVSHLSQYAAIRLFVERAQALEPTFAVTHRNAHAVAQVCRQLDGIPLAIELAAAWVTALPVEQIAERLEERFRLLRGGSRTARPRYRTLRASIDWSYDLLSEPERTLLRRLSVFAGPFTLEAAEAVCSDRGLWFETAIRNEDVLDLLFQLADKSLVAVEPGSRPAEWPTVGCQVGLPAARREAGGGRAACYRLLETTREYARELLAASGEAEAVGQQHAEYFLALAEQVRPLLNGPGECLDRLEAVHDDLRAALAWWTRQPVPSVAGEQAVRLAAALCRFWYQRGYWTEGRRWLAKALECGVSHVAPEFQQARAAALAEAGLLARLQGDNATARSLGEASLALYEAIGDRVATAWALSNMAWTAHEQGDYAAARGWHEQSLRMRREVGDRRGIASSLNSLGTVACVQGDYATARSFCEESLAISRELGNECGAAWALVSLGEIARLQGNLDAAQAHTAESLTLFRESRHKTGTATCLRELAAVAAARGDDPAGVRRAARLFGAAEALNEALGTPIPPSQRADHERSVAAVRAALSEEAFLRAWAEGRAMTLDQAVGYALQTGEEDVGPADE
jgi:predicted ATPase/DNA-binding SARP family transcriptional activator